MNDWSDEETDDPLLADDRNFYKVEEWTRDGMKVGPAIILAKHRKFLPMPLITGRGLG